MAVSAERIVEILKKYDTVKDKAEFKSFPEGKAIEQILAKNVPFKTAMAVYKAQTDEQKQGAMEPKEAAALSFGDGKSSNSRQRRDGAEALGVLVDLYNGSKTELTDKDRKLLQTAGVEGETLNGFAEKYKQQPVYDNRSKIQRFLDRIVDLVLLRDNRAISDIFDKEKLKEEKERIKKTIKTKAYPTLKAVFKQAIENFCNQFDDEQIQKYDSSTKAEAHAFAKDMNKIVESVPEIKKAYPEQVRRLGERAKKDVFSKERESLSKNYYIKVEKEKDYINIAVKNGKRVRITVEELLTLACANTLRYGGKLDEKSKAAQKAAVDLNRNLKANNGNSLQFVKTVIADAGEKTVQQSDSEKLQELMKRVEELEKKLKKVEKARELANSGTKVWTASALRKTKQAARTKVNEKKQYRVKSSGAKQIDMVGKLK